MQVPTALLVGTTMVHARSEASSEQPKSVLTSAAVGPALLHAQPVAFPRRSPPRVTGYLPLVWHPGRRHHSLVSGLGSCSGGSE